MSVIEVRGLVVLGTHGCLEHERRDPQPFEVDLDVETDFAPAARSDDLRDALDYSVLIDKVAARVQTGHFELLEALAQAIATEVLADERVREVTVALRKLRPPLAVQLRTVGVRVVARREGP